MTASALRARSAAPIGWLLLALMLAISPASSRAAETVVEWTVTEGDTLTSLSTNLLVSPRAWREVARFNRLPNPAFVVPGQVLRIPLRLVKSTALDARIVSVVGDVRAGGNPVAEGNPLPAGQALQTGPGSSAVVELADGSRVQLPPSSLAEVVANQQYGAAPGAVPSGAGSASGKAASWFAGALRVLRGSVEVFATKVLRAKPLEVTTPTAVVGVRGTHYRVTLGDEAAQPTRSEVLEGLVRFERSDRVFGADLAAGYGATIDNAVLAPVVKSLPAAPDLSAVPARFERPLVRFELPGETAPVRVQVAQDSNFQKVVIDQRVPTGTDVRIAGLDDGNWFLRARRIDSSALEGFDATRPFVLKARPEPPATLKPRASGKQTAGSVQFAWAQNTEARNAQLQVAEDAAFTRLVLDSDRIADASLALPLTTPGTYYWRMASVRANGDRGPFGDPLSFELRPQPEPPQCGLAADGNGIVVHWSGRPQDRQRVPFARDIGFTQLVAEDEIAQPEWSIARPAEHGSYFFRYRTVEPDGFVSDWSAPLSIEIPCDWSPLLLLVPLILVL
ncbi:hypothetical protein BH11PSE9_BH11PSE9_08920 [soil metagenome]